MTTAAYVVHQVADRCRLRLPQMRGDDEFFDGLRGALQSTLVGASVSTSSTTGSVLIQGAVPDLEELRSMGRDRSWFELVDQTEPGTLLPATSDWPLDLRGDDARHVMTAVFLGLAALQILRGQIMVPATSYLMYAIAMSAISSRPG